LRIIDNGSGRSVDAGRIDITADDADGQIVVIELKAGTAQPEAVTQLLAYMGTIENTANKPVRGILVASDFHRRVVHAAKAVSNLEVKSYSIQFSFQER
jgi:RecB family endonuclease NucS